MRRHPAPPARYVSARSGGCLSVCRRFFCEYTYRVSNRRAPAVTALPAGRSSFSLVPGAIAAWRIVVGAGSPLRALRHFSASLRECARKPSRAIKMPLPRLTTLIVFRRVSLPQHFSCFNFCRARPLPARMRAHIRMSAPSRRTRPRVTANPSDNGIHQKAVAQKRLPLLFSLPARRRKPAP